MMRFDAKTGKYVDAPNHVLGPVQKALGKVQVNTPGPSAVLAVASIAGPAVDATIRTGKDLADKLAAIFAKKKGK